MAQCKVWLDNYTGQYYPGSQIQGKVILNFETETKLRGVKIRIMCREHTEWMGTESYYDTTAQENKTRDTMFQGDNDAFSTEIMLYGGFSGTTSLPVGQHIYPFNLTLPNNLPATYHCEYGSITYKLVAVVDRPMALDYEDQLIFIVIAPVDLNLLSRPELLEPTSYSEDKTVCCWCCAQGTISLDVDLPKRTLVPGETVNIIARVTNMSNVNMDGIEFTLKQKIVCRTEEPSKEERCIENVLIDQNDVGLGAHGEHNYTFPAMLPMNVSIPNFSLCKLYKVEYEYQVVAKLPGVHSNLVVDMWPEIGNFEIGLGSSGAGGFQAPISYPSGDANIPGGYVPFPTSQEYPLPTGYPPYSAGPVSSFSSSKGYGAYPAAPGNPYATPPVGGVPVFPPSAPPVGFDSKSQEASGMSGGPLKPEQPPPSYESLHPK